MKSVKSGESVESEESQDLSDTNDCAASDKRREIDDNDTDSVKDESILFYNMQYCILKTLKSNFLRLQEQQKNADEIGLIYFPLIKGNSFSHLTVFQLLISFLSCISGKDFFFFMPFIFY